MWPENVKSAFMELEMKQIRCMTRSRVNSNEQLKITGDEMSRNFEDGILSTSVMDSLRMRVAVKENRKTVSHVSVFNSKS